MKPPTHKDILSQCDRTTNPTPITTETNQFLLDILELATKGREISLSLTLEDRHTNLQIQMLAMALNQAGFDALEILQKTKH